MNYHLMINLTLSAGTSLIDFVKKYKNNILLFLLFECKFEQDVLHSVY
jgi:hypothetical protein